MILKIFIAGASLLFFSTSFSQDIKGKVVYDFHVNLYNYVEGYKYKSELYFSNNESFFIYNSIELEQKKSFKKNITYRDNSSNGGIYFRNFDPQGYQYYYNKKDNTLISRELLAERYPVLVSESDIDFSWKITNETKNIGNFLAYKATCQNFRGRNYTAWFTYEVPVSFGPWKFNGLPGLILEVMDDNFNIHITLREIQIPYNGEFKIEKPQENEQLSINEFLNENFNLYIRYLENQRGLKATGSIQKDITPIPYVNIEYSADQLKLLSKEYTIMIKD